MISYNKKFSVILMYLLTKKTLGRFFYINFLEKYVHKFKYPL